MGKQVHDEDLGASASESGPGYPPSTGPHAQPHAAGRTASIPSAPTRDILPTLEEAMHCIESTLFDIACVGGVMPSTKQSLKELVRRNGRKSWSDEELGLTQNDDEG